MVLLGNNKIRSDVFDEGLDEKLVPSLGGVVLGSEPDIYTDPSKFFSITLVTEQIVDIIDNIVNVLTEGRGRKIVMLSALYGGGKTHTLIAIHHALKNPSLLTKAVTETPEVGKKIRDIAARASSIAGSVDIVVIDGYMHQLAPHPVAPLNMGTYSVKTLWGYIAHCLGSYSLMKTLDEQVVPPGVDVIVKLFENRRVVILVDELASYIQGISSQVNYVNALKSFIERLAKAIDIAKNVVLIISVPAAVGSGGEIERVEITYMGIRDVVEAVVKSLSRVAVMYVEPVSPRNIPSLLRARLFEYVDASKASEIRKAIHSIYQGHREVFDHSLAEAVVREIPTTYPFHPAYIGILVDMLDKHPKLQKTRDLLKISRRILRSIVSSRDSYELVMPWHINLVFDEGLASYLLRGFEEFRSVIIGDIHEKTRNYEKTWLAQIAANTLLVKTYVYGGGLVPKPDVFPTPEELAVMVYEPKSFSDKGLLPKDIIDAVEWIKHNLVYILEDEKTRRLWFTRFVTPIKYVEDIAKNVLDVDVVKEIEVYTKKLLTASVQQIESRKRSTPEIGRIFDRELSTASYSCDKLDYDVPRYILYACVNVPQDPSSRQSLLEEIAYITKHGGKRRYANTIFIVFPSSREKIKFVFDLMKRHIACKKVEAEKLVDVLVGGYTREERDIVKGVLVNKLKRYCDEILSNTLLNTLSMFDAIAYPVYTEGRNTIKEVNLSVRETIIEGSEHTLQSVQPRKILLGMDFETLDFYLKSIGIDLSTISTPKSVKDIIEYFYSNSRLPAVKEDDVKRALVDGVDNLSIGLLCRDRLYFKSIEICSNDKECRGINMAKGEAPATVTDDCQVLSWRDALVEQLKNLRGRVEGLKVIEYIVNYGGELYRVEDVVADIGKFDIEVLKAAPLLKRERIAAVKLYPEKKELRIRAGEDIELRFTVERLGVFVGEIIIQSSLGEATPSKISLNNDVPRNEFVWRYRAPATGGVHQDVVRLLLPNGAEVARSEVTVYVAGIENCVKGLPKIRDKKVKEMRVEINKLNLKPLQIISTRFRGFNVSGKLELTLQRDSMSSSIFLEFNEMPPDDVYRIVSNIISILSLGKVDISIELNLRAATPKPLPSLPEGEFNELSQYVAEVCLD